MMKKAELIPLPRAQVEALRQFMGQQPHDSVAGGCSWLDVAIARADKAANMPAEEPKAAIARAVEDDKPKK